MAIGTIGAMLGSAVIGGVAQSSAASKAAKAQTQAADAQIGLQREIYEDQTGRFAPFLETGTTGFNALAYELGLGDRPMIGGTAPDVREVQGTSSVPAGTSWFDGEPGRGSGYYDQNGNPVQLGGAALPQGASTWAVGDKSFASQDEARAWANANKTGATQYQGFQKTPGYDFMMQQGVGAIDASAASRGGLMSGRTLQAQTQFGQGLANQEYGNYLNRLAGVADTGVGSAGMQANAGNAFAAGASNALGAKGNAQAAGAIGVGNAFSDMTNNMIGTLGYQKGTTQNTASKPWWLGA